MNIHFLDKATLGQDLDFSEFEALGQVTYFDYTENADREKNINGAQVLVVNKVLLDRDLLEKSRSLKLILLTATGYNNVDLDAAKALGIGVCNIKGYSTASVVQHTFAMLLYLMEPLRFLDNIVRSGEYTRSRQFTHLERTFTEIAGKKWGIIGLGAIGRKVAQLAQAFGAQVHYSSTSGVQRHEDFPCVELKELLSTSDIVSIHAPLTPATRNLLGQSELLMMKPKSFLINVGRGGIIDEKALSQVLETGHLGGVGLDVLSQEPLPVDSPLIKALSQERLYITPHVAWASVESRRRCMDEVRANLLSWMEGGVRNRLDLQKT